MIAEHERKLGDARIPEKWWDRVHPSGGCWIWSSLDLSGYGQVSVGPGGKQKKKAHRVFFEALVGPIPDGLVLDHLCRNKSCVNPAHLEPVTLAENGRRGSSGRPLGSRNKQKTERPRDRRFPRPVRARLPKIRYVELERLAHDFEHLMDYDNDAT